MDPREWYHGAFGITRLTHENDWWLTWESTSTLDFGFWVPYCIRLKHPKTTCIHSPYQSIIPQLALGGALKELKGLVPQWPWLRCQDPIGSGFLTGFDIRQVTLRDPSGTTSSCLQPGIKPFEAFFAKMPPRTKIAPHSDNLILGCTEWWWVVVVWKYLHSVALGSCSGPSTRKTHCTALLRSLHVVADLFSCNCIKKS